METACSVIIPEGYKSVEHYLGCHIESLGALKTGIRKGYCSNPLGGNKPYTAPNRWLRKSPARRVGRPPKATIPPIPVSVHVAAATFERLGRERGIPECDMPTWIEAACRVAVRVLGHPADVVA